jgi:sigma-B regulation protein RsbU (phosphoserine phosphatase)
VYRRISAGHPAELFLRDGAALPALPSPTTLPLGLGHMLTRGPRIVTEQLRPGDTLVLYTDGITEARDRDGALFGVDRLTAFLLGALRADTPPPEMMRQLIHTIVSYENGDLRDDATAALLRWRPGDRAGTDRTAGVD